MFDDFLESNDQASSEKKAMNKVISVIQGTDSNKSCIGEDILLNNLADLMKGPSHKAKPDIYYGARPEQVHEKLRNMLNHYIVPSTTDTRPCAPNLFVEVKQLSGTALVMMSQACFGGALGARCIHKLQTFDMEEPSYDNKAYTISVTYQDGQMKIFAHHIAQPNGPGTEPEYYMNLLRPCAITENRKALVRGITAFRNAKDWAESQRNAAIERANALICRPDEEDSHCDDDENIEDNDDADDEDGA